MMMSWSQWRHGRAAAILVSMCAWLAASCGESKIWVPPSAEDRGEWEGIGIWNDTEDTVEMRAIEGRIILQPESAVEVGGLIWKIDAIEELTSGIARIWPSRDDKWIVVKMTVENTTYREIRSRLHAPVVSETEAAGAETRAAALTRGAAAPVAAAIPATAVDTSVVAMAPPLIPIPIRLLLREKTVLFDDFGERHVPIKVHERIYPHLNDPLAVETEPVRITLVYSMKREAMPVKMEIHDPLSSAELTWSEPRAPSDWNRLEKKYLFSDKAMNVLWEVTLSRTRLTPSDSSLAFIASLHFRNVTGDTAVLPSASEIRLYAGAGKTYYSASLPDRRMLAPGKTARVECRFIGVPSKQSFELVIPYNGEELRIDASNGFFPEKPYPMNAPVFVDGVRVVVYAAVHNAEFRVRAGMTYFGSAVLNGSGISVKGNAGGSWIDGVIEDAPSQLHPGFEERRWFVFPHRVSAIRIELSNRRPIAVGL